MKPSADVVEDITWGRQILDDKTLKWYQFDHFSKLILSTNFCNFFGVFIICPWGCLNSVPITQSNCFPDSSTHGSLDEDIRWRHYLTSRDTLTCSFGEFGFFVHLNHNVKFDRSWNHQQPNQTWFSPYFHVFLI